MPIEATLNFTKKKKKKKNVGFLELSAWDLRSEIVFGKVVTTSGQPPQSHLQLRRVRATTCLRSTPRDRPGRGLLQGTLISHDFSSFSIIFSPTKHTTTKLIVHFHNRFLFPPQITPPLKSFVLKEKQRE